MKRPGYFLWHLVAGVVCGLSLDVAGQDAGAKGAVLLYAKGAVLLYAKGAAGEKMYFQEAAPFPDGISLMMRPLKLPSGSYEPPKATVYWLRMDLPDTPGAAEIENSFPMIKRLPEDQRETSVYYTNVKEGRYVISAWLPEHSEPLAYVIRYVELGQVYHITVPPYVRVIPAISDDLRMDGKIPDRKGWMIILKDLAKPHAVVSTRGRPPGWDFWAPKGHTYEGWVVTKTWVERSGPKLQSTQLRGAGYKIARFTVGDNLRTDDVIHLKLLGLENPPIKIDTSQ